MKPMGMFQSTILCFNLISISGKFLKVFGLLESSLFLMFHRLDGYGIGLAFGPFLVTALSHWTHFAFCDIEIERHALVSSLALFSSAGLPRRKMSRRSDKHTGIFVEIKLLRPGTVQNGIQFGDQLDLFFLGIDQVIFSRICRVAKHRANFHASRSALFNQVLQIVSIAFFTRCNGRRCDSPLVTYRKMRLIPEE